MEPNQRMTTRLARRPVPLANIRIVGRNQRAGSRRERESVDRPAMTFEDWYLRGRCHVPDLHILSVCESQRLTVGRVGQRLVRSVRAPAMSVLAPKFIAGSQIPY